MNTRVICYFLLWCVSSIAFGQEEGVQTPDSLKNKKYGYLYAQYQLKRGDTIVAKLYLNAYLYKATIADHKINKAIALNLLSYYAKNKEDQLDFINKSLLESNSVDSIFSIAAYNNLGLYYQGNYDYGKAVQQYLKALRFSKKRNNKRYEIIALGNIANLKRDIGAYKDALTLYKDCLALEKEMGPINENAIVEVSLNLAESYSNNKKYDSASYYYKLVIDKVRQQYPYFLSKAMINEGVNLYYKNDLKDARRLLQEGSSLINFNVASHIKYYTIAQLYLGKIARSSNNKILEKKYFLKVDSLLTKIDVVIPEVREVYTSLIKDYKENNNYREELHTINKLVKFDSIAFSRKINITDKLNSEFDTPELLKSKEQLIKKLESENQNLNVKVLFLLLLFFCVMILFFLQYRKHKIYKERFEKIITELNDKPDKTIEEPAIKQPQKLNIDPQIVAIILDKLLVFESKKGFLKSTITVSTLARKLSTNTKYLSKIINVYKGKTFIHYINDLRIEYILKELKTNPTLHRYTILGIAKEASFNSAESFSAAFKKKTGITPAYYIKSLKRDMASTS